MGLAAASGGAVSGLLLAGGGYPLVTVTGAVAAAVIVPVLAVAGPGRPAAAVGRP